jgi:hypothetical protein
MPALLNAASLTLTENPAARTKTYQNRGNDYWKRRARFARIVSF